MISVDIYGIKSVQIEFSFAEDNTRKVIDSQIKVWNSRYKKEIEGSYYNAFYSDTYKASISIRFYIHVDWQFFHLEELGYRDWNISFGPFMHELVDKSN